MQGALVILAALVIIGLLLYITDVKYFRHKHADSSSGKETVADEAHQSEVSSEQVLPDICCGQHLVCEKINPQIWTDTVIYYDDEELDRFAGRASESYSSEEIEEFRDVLMTLLPQDIPGWAKSIDNRKIELPGEVRDELLMLIADL